MNYLGHMLMAYEQDSDFRFGSVAPDLAGMNGLRVARCSPSDIDRARRENVRRMLRGIRFHHQTDTAFDSLASLEELKKLFYTNIAPEYLRPDSHHALLLAGAGTDMLVDGEVQRHWPDINALHSITMLCTSRSVVFGAVRAKSGFRKELFYSVVRERSATPVPDYQDPERVASMLATRVNTGRLKHISIGDEDTPGIARAIEAYQPHIRTYGFGLIRATAERLGVRLPDPVPEPDLQTTR